MLFRSDGVERLVGDETRRIGRGADRMDQRPAVLVRRLEHRAHRRLGALVDFGDLVLAIEGALLEAFQRRRHLREGVCLVHEDQGDLQIFYSSSAWRVKCSGGTGVSTIAMSLNTWQLHSFVYNGNGSSNAQKLRYRYNKADQALTITGTIAAKSSGSNDNYVWAAQDSSSSNPFKGQIGEVFIFNKALSSGEVAAIETYLGSKWGV